MVYCILVAVSKEDSILYYTEDGTDWSTYNNNSFVPVFTDNIGNWVWPSEEVKTEAHNIIENTDNTTFNSADETGYIWEEPAAWSSDRLYPWGPDHGDTDLMHEPETWQKYDKCKRLPLNGKAGALFFDKRHYNLHICTNGVIDFESAWRQYYPSNFGSYIWLNQQPFFSPFWSMSDEVSRNLLAAQWPRAATSVYYQVYKRNVAMSEHTDDVLRRAEADVSQSGKCIIDIVIGFGDEITSALLEAQAGGSLYMKGIASGGHQSVKENGEVEYKNLPGSGTLKFADIDSTPGNMKDKRVGEWLFRVEESDGIETPAVKCLKWVTTQNEQLYGWFNRWSHCPQTLSQALSDTRFTWYQGLHKTFPGSLCFQTTFADWLGSGSGLRQRCCYDEKTGGIFVAELSSPWSCHRFWPWFGDPHIVTSDGFSYTFNGLGEYLFTRIADNGTVIQARTERVKLEDGSLGQATYFSAVCIALSGLPRVQIQINKSPLGAGIANTTQLIINGTVVDISAIESEFRGAQTIEGVDRNIMFERDNTSITVFFFNGLSIKATSENKMLTITIGMPDKFKGSTVGLTGVFDGDQENDLTYLNGTGHISINSTEMEIFDWASTFAVSEEDSIMYYTEDGTDWSTYNNNSFVPVFTDNIDNWVWPSEEVKTEAYNTCGNDTFCIYDIYVTEDLEVGKSSKVVAETSAKTNDDLSNFAPEMYGDDYIVISDDGEFNYSMYVNDSNGDSFSISTNVANSSIIVEDGLVTIVGQISGLATFQSFSILVTDLKGAASTKNLLVMVCQCVNNGTCETLSETERQSLEIDVVVLDCICPTGYTGDTCDTDLDACSLVASPCYPSVLCVDSPPPADHTGYTCGDCPPGYTGDGKTCIDVDECLDDARCGHRCINSPGSYVCACFQGHELNENGATCDDINECEVLAPCHQICDNTPGSFQCSCTENMVLSVDNINCEPSSACNATAFCDAANGICGLVNGTEVCSCVKGYTLNGDGKTCDETDECALGTDACSQICTNTDGGYNCSCESGYDLDVNGFTCNDINECFRGIFECENSHVCENKKGGYDCICPENLVKYYHRCTVVEDSSSVPNLTGPVKIEAENNAITFNYYTARNEFTVRDEILLKRTLAHVGNEVCSVKSCHFIQAEAHFNYTSDDSNKTAIFDQESFARTPGHVSYKNNGRLQLTFYAFITEYGFLSATDLLEVVIQLSKNTSNTDEIYITVIEDEPLGQTTSTVSSDDTERSKVANELPIAVGISAGVLLLIAVALVIHFKVEQSR
ncbi:hypothetical protein EB796_019247 [Bugula neritina]|uniref:Mucin-like protein n=1 Tax=Bugula neritina TaxID=10212 RepID=A0A7J7J899_BUGNE|nr:hypothetical protein EB796_019247 [Bugula neritina]